MTIDDTNCLIDGQIFSAADRTCAHDTGSSSAWMSPNMQMVPGAKNMIFGGEGIFNTVLTGPGRVWLQTRPICNAANVIRSYIPTGSK